MNGERALTNRFQNQSSAKEITVIGAAVIDILAGPVGRDVFLAGSQPMDEIKLSFGGDALNEAIALTRMGRKVELVSNLGLDDAGDQVFHFLTKEGLSADSICRQPGLQTSINIVLVDEKGERYFLTNPKGSLRKLAKEDVMPHINDAADIVSFAGMFVSPLLDIAAMEQIFRKIKEKPGRRLVVDMTKAKKGECLKDLCRLLPHIDFILPNEDEIALLTGEKDPYLNAGLLIEAGVSCAVIKCGRQGCLIRTKNESLSVPAYPVKNAVDSTGAGDCFAAGFLWGLSQNLSLRECACLACATASCTVEHFGATEGIISAKEPMRRYYELAHGNPEILSSGNTFLKRG